MESNKTKRKETVIGFSGDLSFSSKLQKQYLAEEPIEQALLDFLNTADAAVINQESPVTSYRDIRSKKTGLMRRICHRSDPEVLGYFKTAFKNPILSFANNHMNDMSDIGIIDSIENSEKYGVKFIGIGRNKKEAFKYEIVGEEIKVGIFAVEYKDFKKNKERSFIGPGLDTMTGDIKKTIDEIREKADYAVLVYHGGAEFLRIPDPDKRKLLKSFLDMGCDAIVSHHPHVVQGYEMFGSKPVFYSLGNFMFDTDYQRSQEGTDKGLLLRLAFSDDGISFETAGINIDRDTERALKGEIPDTFREITDAGYNDLWKEEQKYISLVDKRKEENKDEMFGSIYYREYQKAGDVLNLIAMNRLLPYFRHMTQKPEEKRNYIEKDKKLTGIGQKEDKYYIAYLIGSEKWIDHKAALKELEDFCTGTGIEPGAYYKYGLYRMPYEDALREAGLIRESSEKYNIAWLISVETGDRTDSVMNKLRDVCRHSNIDPELYYRRKLYRLSKVGAVLEAKRLKRAADRLNDIREIVCSHTGQTREELENDKKAKGVKTYQYYHYGIYDLSGEELKKRKQAISEIQELIERVRKNTYAGNTISPEIQADIDRIYELMRESLSEERIAEMAESVPADASGNRVPKETAIDIHIMQQVWGYTPDEYNMFRFEDKTMAERLKFVSTALKNDVINEINPPEACDLLNNKYLTYKRLGVLFGREAVLYDGTNLEELKEFVKGKDSIVIKSLYDSMGKGVKLIRLPLDDTEKQREIEKLADEHYESGGDFMVEELIAAHESIRKLNSTSVNTVRICTYNDNGTVVIHDSFAKIGREGSFVDNGGAGGIFAHIDINTGVVDSDGVDESGTRYTAHPDNGTVFKGYAFPEWDKALEIAKKASAAVPEMGYIGWDLTYTEDCRWIIVEGNARTQFLGQQAVSGIGTMDSFAKVLGGYDKLRSYYKGDK